MLRLCERNKHVIAVAAWMVSGAVLRVMVVRVVRNEWVEYRPWSGVCSYTMLLGIYGVLSPLNNVKRVWREVGVLAKVEISAA